MADAQTVLVTGSGGFIGGRIVEVLHLLGREKVRAGVRRWSGAARVGRFPVDIVRCDVLQPDDIARALEGVSAVVHCAVGNREVTVRGTENLLDAAHRTGLQRAVHISTIDVYGTGDGVFDESQPLAYTGREYGDSKIDAEKACMRYVEKGLPVAILRPTLVYGPFSASWTVEWAQRLQSPPWLLADEDCRGTCNLLYVDDLVAAVRLALHRKEAIGETFNVSGPEQPSWSQYLGALNDALGLPPLRAQSLAKSHLSARLIAPVRASAKFLLANYAGTVKSLYDRYPIAKSAMRFAEKVIKRTPTAGEFEFLSRGASFPIEKAKTRLGYQPAFTMPDGIALSVAWLRHHGYHRDGFERA